VLAVARASKPTRVSLDYKTQTLTLNYKQRPKPNFPLNLPIKRNKKIYNQKEKKKEKQIKEIKKRTTIYIYIELPFL